MKLTEQDTLIRLGNIHVAYGTVIEDLTRKFKKNPPPKDAAVTHMLTEDVLRVLRKERNNIAAEALKLYKKVK